MPRPIGGALVALPLLVVTLVGSIAPAAGSCPEATSWGPLGSDAPVDAAIVIEWTLAMDAASVEAAFNLTGGSTSWNASQFVWSHTATPPYRSEAAPRSSLRSKTDYTVRVDAAAKDASGNYSLDQDADGVGGETGDALTWTFRTEDLGLPWVESTMPSDGATGVPVTAAVTVRFNEAMEPEATASSFSLSPRLPGTIQWDPSASAMTFDPGLNFTYGTTYAARLDGTKARDADGHALDADHDGLGGDDYQFSFGTEADPGPPTVLLVSPANGTTSASVSANVAITFSETMDRASVEDAFAYTDGTRTWTRTNGTFSWSGLAFADDRVAFNPYANFPFSATLTFTVSASAARDPAGFLLDGNGNGTGEGSPEDDVTWSFETEAVDLTPPVVSAVDPPDGATNVSEATSVAITFSESMDRGRVEASFLLGDGFATWTAANGTFSWNQGDDAAVFLPETNLAQDRLYTLTLQGDIAEDVNGNLLDGDGGGVGGDDFTARFRTRAEVDEEPPHVVSTNPSDGATGIERLPTVYVTFDDAMDRASTEGAILLLNASGQEPAIVPIEAFEWSAANKTVAFQPSVKLAWDAWHRVVVAAAAQDDAGHALEEAYQFAFQTAAWNVRVFGRVLEENAPAAGATVTLGNHTTKTSASGAFEFLGVREGRYNLTISKPGYETHRISFTLAASAVGPDATEYDLGTIAFERAVGIVPILVMGGFLIFVAVALGAVLWIRRRHPPPTLDDQEEEPGGADP